MGATLPRAGSTHESAIGAKVARLANAPQISEKKR
jgi:hypothetical protein